MTTLSDFLDDADFNEHVPWAIEHYKKGEIIVEEGEHGTDVYLILDGEVNVVSKLDDKLKSTLTSGLAKMSTKDIFGELSMFDSKPRSARVEASSNCKVAKIEGAALISYMDNNPDKGYFVMRDILMNLIIHMRQNNLRSKTILQLYLQEHEDC